MGRAAKVQTPRAAVHRRPFPQPQVLGNAKGVVAVVVSVLYFQNPINKYTTLGYGVTVVGVVMYSKVGAVAAVCVGTLLFRRSSPSLAN